MVDAPQLGGQRALTVYLPPDYEDTPRRSWPLVIAHDGQEMAAWKLSQALAHHHAQGGDTPIVAALSAGNRRLDDYGTAGVPNTHGQGGQAAAFQLFVTDTVLPRLRRRYRLRNEAAATAVIGASLGGLSAFDLAWRHPHACGIAGVFSGSFWWRTDDSNVASQQASRVAHRRVRETAAAPALRLWFEAGTRDEQADRDGNGVIDAIQDTTELVDELAAKGFRRGKDVVYFEVRDGEHNPATWARALPHFLAWAFPKKTDPKTANPDLTADGRG
ncbi:MAG: putative esterase [Verrucomicrobia bacterium]|nr:putative esterase [Verrucomicrobiota bacterium]